MCAENSLVFSGYACDIWAAGVCLYIFSTGKLPFYSDIPLVLFDMIAEGDAKYDNVKISDGLKDMLKTVMAKNPSLRAGIGDCLKHPSCKLARNQRIKELGEEVEKNNEVSVQHEDLRQAFSETKQKSFRNLANIVSEQVLSLKKLFSSSRGSQSPQSPSMKIDEIEDTAKKGAAIRKGVRFSFPAQRTKRTDDDRSSDKDSRRPGSGQMFWRSTGQF